MKGDALRSSLKHVYFLTKRIKNDKAMLFTVTATGWLLLCL